MRIESTVSAPGEKWYACDTVLLSPDATVLMRRRALILYSPTTSYGFHVLISVAGVVFLLTISVVSLWNGSWLGFASALLLAIVCGAMAIREESIDLIRFDRRGMTICSAFVRGRRRRRIPFPHLQSARAHREWIRGWAAYNYRGPRDAAILNFGSSAKPFIILHLGRWEDVDRTAEAVNNWIQTMRCEPIARD